MQDDIRVRRNLTLSAGVRYEAQTHVDDYDNLMPRFGVTWAPFASGATTLRASWGIFYDWLPTNTYEQTLRVDGFRQQELDIVNPPYPDSRPDAAGARRRSTATCSATISRCRASTRVSLGVDQRLHGSCRRARPTPTRAAAPLARGLNLNAPVDGVRPDPRFGNIIEVVSDASSRQHQLQINLTVEPGRAVPAAQDAPLIQLEARRRCSSTTRWRELETTPTARSASRRSAISTSSGGRPTTTSGTA